MQTSTRAFQALHEVAVAAAGLRDPSALAALVVDRARDFLEADAAALYWYFPDSGTLRTLAHNDPREVGPEPPFNPGEGAAGRAFAEALPVRVDDYGSWPYALPDSLGRGIESGLAVPLMVSHHAVGCLGVFNRQTREWTSDDEQLLILFAAQVAPAMEAARLTQETIEQAHNFRALHEVAIAAGGLRDLAELGRLVADRARQLLKSESATLRWWDPATNSLRLLASIPAAEAGRERIAIGQGALGQAFERQEPAVIENYGQAPRTVEWAVENGVKSALGVPVMAREEALGALGVATYTDRHYTRQEVQLLTLLAAQVGPALEAARLYHESERRRREAEAFAELVRQGAAQEDTEHAVEMIAEQACKLVGADYSAVVLVSARGEFEVKAHHGAHPANWGGRLTSAPDSHAAQVAAEGRSIALHDSDLVTDPVHHAEGGRSAIGTPLRAGDEQVGALILGWRQPLETIDEHVQLVEAVAGYAATIIDNVRTHERERHLAIEAAARSAELAAVIDHIPDGVYVADLEGRIVLMNPAGNAMMGGGETGGDISGGIGSYTILDPDTRLPISRQELAMARALRGETVSRAESIVQREGAPEIRLESSAVPLHNAEGVITGAVIVFSDVTRERNLVGELAVSEERFRSLYGMVACGVLVEDSKGRVMDANAPAEEILGWSLAEMEGKKASGLWQAITEDGKSVPLNELPAANALKSGQPMVHQVLGIKRRTGDVKWVQIDTIPVFRPDGVPLQVVSSFIDITDHKAAEQKLAESEAKYRLLFDRNPEAMWVLEAGPNRFLAVNDTAVERYGYSRMEFLAMSPDVIQPPEELARLGAAGAENMHYSGPWRHRRRNGGIIAVEVSSHPLEFDGRDARLVIAADVSERKRVQDQLAESELKLRTIFDQAPIGLARVDLTGKIQEANLALRTMLGHTEQQLMGLRFDRVLHSPGGGELDLIREFLKGDRDHYTAELPIRRRDGTRRWGSVSLSLVRGAEKEPLYLIGMLEDISDRKAQTELLEYQALHDSLTDLPNRTLLHDRLQQAILTAQRENRQLALLIMDLNRFKEVNDTFGHHLGDVLLQQVGPRIMAQLRESDTVARLGGDEFAVVLPTADDEAGATHAARRLLKALEEPFVIEERRLEVGGSIGIAITPQHGADPATLMRRADIAMYVAKRTRSGYAVYAPEQDKHSPGRLSLMGELRDALQGDALVLHYQPQVSLPSGTVTGVEALIRWQHPRHGLMPPDEFLSIAEETGLIVGVSEWALNAALEQSRSWGDEIDLPISVNLSTQNLQDHNLPALIATLLERHSATPDRLKIEVTETALMADPRRSVEIFAQLREMGVRISIDDFGSGYSSLAYLKQLPVDELKIDRTFVIGISPNAEEVAIVRSAIDIGHSLGLTVVAEGVETQAAWDLLAELGCDMVQGYLITRPLPARQLGRWLSAGWAPRARDLTP
jgi:diguanylate cyclase (GGDEF)-like protein/PAS domain S-box-containing protein